jgi:hypothetical protein
MKYVRTTGFLIDLRRLPEEHRKLFVRAVHEVLRPALDAGAHTGAVPWPRALRVHRIGVNYSMTWSFAGPDGRALFRLAEVAGERVVVWLRCRLPADGVRWRGVPDITALRALRPRRRIPRHRWQ